MSQKPIGIFDSGIGGLAITNNILKAFPHEDIIYVADTKNVPYGSKSVKEIKGFVSDVVKFLLENKVKAIVIACNTATANSNHLDIDVPVIGMIGPTVEEINKTTKNKKVLILATQATVNSGLYQKYLAKHEIVPLMKPAPEFVLLVETLKTETKESYQVVNDILNPYKNLDLDTVVLGCTHFGFLRSEILKALPDVVLVDGSKEVSFKLKEALTAKEKLNSNEKKGKLNLYTTGSFADFSKQVSALKIKYDKIEKISL